MSGLSVYALRLAEELGQRGHTISILTSRHRPDIPREEKKKNMLIIRVPYIVKFHKGLFMPKYIWHAWRQIQKNDRTVVHLPQVESVIVAVIALLLRKKLFVIYHCDVALPHGYINKCIGMSLLFLHRFVIETATKVVTATEDYARHSPLLKGYLGKTVYIYPPVDVPSKKEDFLLSKKFGEDRRYKIGFVGRFSAEKGIEYLLETIPYLKKILDKDFCIVFAGPKNPVGEERYWKILAPLLATYKDNTVFVENIPEEAMGSFYQVFDVLVLPSVNSTEAFGMVQIEAMLCGIPVVASNLPGIRVPVELTGMGELARPNDPHDLAKKIATVIQSSNVYKKKQSQITKIFSYEGTISSYEKILTGIS